ncbi:MAG: hypothetical protein II891_03725 [Bacteroidales bacterium]|nr:hypothetical protein [Bacteroidales bacterium]
MKIYRLLNLLAALCLSVFVAGAQNQPPQTPQEKEKQLLEFVDKEVQRLSSLLDLEYWQEFYVDSTLTHDYRAMTEEMESMQKAKVENRDLYVNVQDKWMQAIDDSYKRFFTEEQWTKYWKSGARRAQEARDKRNKKKK